MASLIYGKVGLAACALLLATHPLGYAQGEVQEPAVFKDKVVLLLPVINTTGEKWEELKKRITDETSKMLAAELATAGYTVMPELDALKVLEASKIDLNDEESWRKDTFYDLGKAAQAEFVVFSPVTMATQRTRNNFLSVVPEGDVTLKVWIVNAKTRTAIISAKAINAKARAKSNVFGEARGSDCQVEAARRAAKEAIKQGFGAPKPPGGR